MFLANSICGTIKADATAATSAEGDIKVSEDAIIKHAIELCDILQFEFIFSKPCEQLDYALSEVVDKFKFHEILISDEVC